MKTIVVAEKPSVARDIARVLGARSKGEGLLEGNGYVVTWALYLAAKNTPFPVFPIGGRIAAAPRAKTGNARERTA